MRKWAAIVLVLCALFATITAPALADGGPFIRDFELWEALEEGQQIAVVALDADGTVHTDLFVSLIDHTGVPHEITFFVPLGWQASDFDVYEENSSDFEAALTDPLDQLLQKTVGDERRFARNLRWSLLPGSWVINGAWTWPLLALFAFTACGTGAPAPLEVLHTGSSQVSIYGVEEDTDLAALTAATGLDPSVQETLRALEGQQIAVVQMRTRPPAGGDTSSYTQRRAQSQRGLHLRWTSHPRERVEGGWEHRYPLGTGGSWARPIPLTRVYVTAPPGVHFRIEYPAYGAEHSGYQRGGLFSGPTRPRIYAHAEEMAYAADHLITPQTQLWRLMYTQANPTEDVYIIHDATAADPVRTQVRHDRVRQAVEKWGWLGGVVLALAVWLFCWRYVMPRRLGLTYRWGDRVFWRDALIWPLGNGLIFLALYLPGSILWQQGNEPLEPVATIVALLAIVLALPVSSALFGRLYRGRKAVGAYWAVAGLANLCYLILGVGYALLLGQLAG